MADQTSIRLLNDKSLKRLQKTADSLSTWANIEPFQLNTHTQYTRDPGLIAAYQLEDIANWAEKLEAYVKALAPAKD